MKKFIILLLVLSTSLLMAYSKNQRRSIALKYLKNYNSDGYYILHKYNGAPATLNLGNAGKMTLSKTDFVIYVEGNNLLDILVSLSTTVHEICHGYTAHIGSIRRSTKEIFANKEQMAIYNGSRETIMVPITRVFPSRNMAHRFSSPLKTLRFTYIASKSKYLGTQVHGIYGLLDEFNAYSHGTQTALDLIKPMMRLSNLSMTHYSKILQSIYGSYYAYYEFKLYILKYLIYARRYKPQIYKGIIENKNFKKAFIEVDKRFSKVIQLLTKKKRYIFSVVRSKGYDVREGPKSILFMKDGSGLGVGTFGDVARKLKKELSKNIYVAIFDSLKF